MQSAEFLKQNGLEVWLDVNEVGTSLSSGLFGEITKGLNKAKLVVACVSDEYVKAQNCTLEFRFSHVSLKLPIIKAIVGTGQEWRKDEIAFIASNYPEFNFQDENKGSYIKSQEISTTRFRKYHTIFFI